MYTLEGVSSGAKFITAFEGSQLNRDSHLLIRSVFFDILKYFLFFLEKRI